MKIHCIIFKYYQKFIFVTLTNKQYILPIIYFKEILIYFKEIH